MASTPSDIPKDPGNSGQLQHRSVCNPPQCPVGTVCELEARPQFSGNRCPTTTLEQMGGLCLPPFLSNWQMYQEGERRQGFPDSGGTSLEVTAVVSSFTQTVSGLSPNASTATNTPVRPIRQTTSNRTATISRLETIRHRQQADGISSEPISCAIQPFLEFLTTLFREGVQYQSINTIQSAISMTHNQIDRLPMGQHALVSIKTSEGCLQFVSSTTQIRYCMGY